MRLISVTWFACLIITGCVTSIETDVVYSRSEFNLSGLLCKPKGSGPWPAVMFNHGGLGKTIGGAPKKTCAALAQAGYVGFSPIRRPTRPLYGHLDDVRAALDYIKSQDFVYGNRIAMMGFSRGGMLTYQTAILREDLKAVIIMAMAVNRFIDLNTSNSISAPVLLLVAKNDTGSHRTRGRNTLEGMRDLNRALNFARKKTQLIEYPPYGNDGHLLFFSIDHYWKDILLFLETHL